ncbi:pullulanase-type alpha-1,6-glucosidase [Microbacterium sp. NPDC019599]|uniref:pullulanase-type alpha-1,6-glucosidase n=1 Tax=Microbacterium sp. NPDC019599 TaxID=3154690 RepID=UPI0033F86294
MSKTTTARRRRVLATLTAAALVLAGSVTALAAPATAADRTFALVGDLQSELGCPGDWQPDCTQTELELTTEADVYAAEFNVPAGTWHYKVAVDDGWAESYGLDGGSGDIPLVIEGPTRLRFLFDDDPGEDGKRQVGVKVVDVTGGYTTSDDALAAAPVRQPGSDEQFYFVMTDRFANGDTSNDQGGLTGDRLVTGFDPTSTGFYNGGDIAGLHSQLDYIAGLGTTAIWLTPSFKNKSVQGTGANVSAGYHGYWITDFTQIDPHLGTNQELQDFIEAAHLKDIKVYFDIITNHTADVISYAENTYDYVDIGDSPYYDADGNEIDIAQLAGADTFPPLDVEKSFPYTPVIADAEKDVKVPAWLNDPTLYHNRGDSTFQGESTTYGDFFGLDDLMTEHPTVVDGFAEVYKDWIDLGIDGFRIDTAKHVNFEFWEKWSTDVLDYAHSLGKDEFFMFGEVYEADPAKLAPYVRGTDMNSVLDFAFQAGAQGFAEGKPAKGLSTLFAGDDRYTTPDSSATALPTFLGNHDMGRIGSFLREEDQTLERDLLAHDLLFLTRGQPVVYYGDEQGFAAPETGAVNDRAARQTLFASDVAEYVNQPLVTGETLGSQDRYDTDAPVYEHIAALAQLRADHPALATGAQIERYAAESAGIYAFSRVDRSDKTEYLVAVNNATTEQTVSLTTLTADATFAPVYGTDASLTTDASSAAPVTVPALSARVWKADSTVSAPAAASGITVDVPVAGAALKGSAAVSATADDAWRETSFAWRVIGSEDWHALGTAEDTAPGVFHDVDDLAPGTLVEYRAVSTDAAGQRSAASTYGSVGHKVNLLDDGPQGPFITVPGSFNDEVGCPGDWQPDCEAITLTEDDGVFTATFAIPAGDYEYKVAVGGSWDENYGANGVPGGPNIAFTLEQDAEVTFYYDPRTNIVQSTAEGPIVTLPGDYQSEMGCPGDWQPDCLVTLMADGDKNGVYEFTTDQIPAGSYKVKVAHGLSWNENYGQDGVPGGSDIPFEVEEDGDVVTFRYTLATHVLQIGEPGLPGVGQLRAHWIDAQTIAWPTGLGAPADEATWQLYSSTDAALELSEDDEVTGGEPIALTRVAGGLTPEQKERFPALKDFVALQVEGQDRDAVATLLKGQLMVAQRNAEDEVTAFTGVQIPGVLDDLYAAAVEDVDLGVTFEGKKPTFRLWAPTAQTATLLTWDAGATGDPVRHDAAWDAASGTWTVKGKQALKGDEYLWEVVVYAPTTTAIETNDVTDPYSVALTENSERSVAVDLDDKQLKPKQWEKTAAPVVERPVDHAIYELHIRDFSETDQTVPEDLRGTYLAFTQKSAGTAQLEQLADAGITTVHLLPSFDIASIEEDEDAQQEPACDLAALPADSDQQQSCIDAVADADAFNWGYDPYHYTVPEGSYATDPDGGARIGEFRSMVGALHGLGLQVVLDEVFNHTAESGQGDRSVLDRVVPGYYHRLNAAGGVETSTCCQNVATEHVVAQKLMVDSVVTWARDYKVDGFRFDLMGHHSKENMLAVRAALDELTLKNDGVDGESIYLYGEGWNFGEVANNSLFEQATQGQLGGTGIGTFNDRLRDGVHGGSPVRDSTYEQGFGTGLGTDPNGQDGTADEQLARLGNMTDLVKIGLAGNLRDFEFMSADGTVKSGAEIDYNGAPAGYADEPDETINYVDAHDNNTLYDLAVLKLPVDTSMADRVRMNTLSLATVTLSQSPSFWHAGTELLRSKSLDDNSYNSGDWFNRIDWTGQESTFGSGLPMEADNGDRWDILKPLLANPALKPAAADIAAAEASALDLLKVRNEVDLLRLGSAELIDEKVSFPNSGTDAAPGVIVMLIDDLLGDDVDPALEGALVVFNASPEATTQTIPALEGRGFSLTPALANGSDSVVKTTQWNAATGAVTVPARTVAVLVDREPVGTKVIAAPSRLVAPEGAKISVAGRVLADDGSAPVGTLTVTDGGRTVATASLAASAKGRFDISLPKLGKGVHLLRVSFTGADAWGDSRAILPVPVLVH